MESKEDKLINFMLNYKNFLDIIGTVSVLGLIVWLIDFGVINFIGGTQYQFDMNMIIAKMFFVISVIYLISLLIFVIIIWIIGFDVLYFLRYNVLSIDIPTCFGEMDNTTNCHKCKHIKRCKEYKES